MRTKRIAIIGAGGHARDQHYPALRHIDETQLCAACDLIPQRLEEVRRLYDIPAGYTNYREMIEKEAPDGVVVVLRPMEMVDVALGCLDLKANLMIEKPPGCNSQEAQRILDRAREKGCKVMVSLNRRFMPMVRALKDMAREKGLVHCSATYNKDGFFKGKWTWPGSLPVCDSIHLIDLMRFVGGEVAKIYAVSAMRRAEFTNTHSAMIVYESGAMGTINTHHCVGGRVHRFEIHSHSMSAYVDVGDTHNPACDLWLDGKRAEVPSFEMRLPAKVGIENYYETRHFARFVAGEEEGEATLADAIQSVRLAEAVAAGFRGKMSDFRQDMDSKGPAR
jgi:predicted dehydrogenase